jgi:hypothetical protein
MKLEEEWKEKLMARESKSKRRRKKATEVKMRETHWKVGRKRDRGAEKKEEVKDEVERGMEREVDGKRNKE